MKKLPKGLAVLEVMIGAALAIIAIAIFLNMQGSDNKLAKSTSFGQDIGLYLNHVLAVSENDYTQVSNGPKTYTYSASANNLGNYSGSSNFMQNLTEQGVQSITVTVDTQRDEDAE